MANGKKVYYLYLIGAKHYYKPNKFIYAKIGHTSIIDKRFCALECASPMKLKILALFSHSEKSKICKMERDFKSKFYGYKTKREWFFYEKELLDYFIFTTSGESNG